MLRCAITDRALVCTAAHTFPPAPGSAPPLPLSSACGPLVERCAALARSGLDLLLIREKDLPPASLAALCRTILSSVRAASPRTRVLVSSRADIALASGLDGVHLSAHPAELTPAHIRRLFRHAALPDPCVSVSCHTLEEVRRARETEASTILFAPVFGKSVFGKSLAGKSPTLVTPPAGLAALRAACREAAPLPVFALGGVTAENAPACIHAGAAGIAGIRLFMLGNESERMEETPCSSPPSI